MRAIFTSLKSSSRLCTPTMRVVSLVMLLCFLGTVAHTQTVTPNVVVTQQFALGALPGNGAQSGAEPAGDTMAVNSAGDIITTNTYNNKILLFTPTGSSPTTLGSLSNPNGVAVDSQNNLYIGLSYIAQVIKVPYVNGSYVTISATSASTPNCTGTDTAECLMSNLTTGGGGVISMVFDTEGDLFYGTTNNNQGGNNPNAIYECTAACLYSGTPAPVLLFQEPTAASPNITGQLSLGGMALDKAGNLFFTDSAIGATNNQESFSSNVKELPFAASSGYASTPTVIYTYTPPTPANYDAEVDGVAVDANDTVYALVQNVVGVLAFPSTNGTYNSQNTFLVSTRTGKLMTSDTLGNLYIVDENGSLTKNQRTNIIATGAATGSNATTSVTTILNDSICTSSPTVTFTASGGNGSAFAAATSGACAAAGSNSASFATTVTFTPTIAGINTATLTATDSSNNNSAITVTGAATGTLATPTFSVAAGTYTSVQQITITSASGGASIYYTTDGSTPTTSSTLYTGPITLSASKTLNAIAVEAGDTTSAIGTAAYTLNIPPTNAPVFSIPAGTYSSTQAVTLTDSTSGASIYYTTNGSTPTTSSTLYTAPIAVSSTETINTIATSPGATNSTVATAAYTISVPASAFQNVVMSQITQFGTYPTGGAQSGGEPSGTTIVVNPAGNLITTDTYGNQILSFPPSGATPSIVASWSNPNGVAQDSRGNLYFGQSYGPDVVKLPYANGSYAAFTSPGSGTPNCTGTDTAECLMSNLSTGGGGVLSLVFDSQGDLFYATTNSNQGGNNPNTIYECTAACLYTGTPAPSLIFAEPTASAPNTTGQLSIGGMAIDTSGNLFFTDSAIGATNNQESFSSNLKELPLTSGTYATVPTVIYTYTPAAPANYDAEIDGVAVGANDTAYALIQGVGGIIAVPNVSGTYSSSNAYLVATQTGKLMTSDVFGNLWVVNESNNVYEVVVDNLAITQGQVGGTPSATTNITTILNDGACTSSPTVTFTGSGTNGSAFTAGTTGACVAAGVNSGSSAFATTVTFTPTTAGGNAGTLTAKDSAGNSGAAEVTATATAQTAVSTPTFSPVGGSYTAVQTVTISDSTGTATIYYTTDGSTPTTSSTMYSSPITVSSTETINAIATSTGLANSQVATATYTLTLPTPAPTFSPIAGAYTTIQTVAISDSINGASIYYTIDGSTPTTKATLYSGPVTVAASETINAIAAAKGYNTSSVASASYAITLPPAATPTFSVASGTYTTVQTVTIADTTAKASIYYTTNGTTPTTSSTLYTAPITVATSSVVNAIAIATGYSISPIGTANYTLNLPAPGFTLTSSTDGIITVPAGGKGTATITITANATYTGQMALTCSGFLPVGYTCVVSPATLTPPAGGTASTTVTVTAPTLANLRLPNQSVPLLAGTMLLAALSLVGFIKRRRCLQMFLLFAVSIIGLSFLSGCGSGEQSTGPTSTQIIVTATAAQPLPAPPIVQNIPFAVELQ